MPSSAGYNNIQGGLLEFVRVELVLIALSQSECLIKNIGCAALDRSHLSFERTDCQQKARLLDQVHILCTTVHDALGRRTI